MGHRSRRIALVLFAVALAPSSRPAVASVLGDKNQEIHLGVMARLDPSDAPKAGLFEWTGVLGKGHNELGVSLLAGQNYFSQGPFDKTASLYGIVYTFNWTPEAPRATGFLSLSAGGVAPSQPFDRYASLAFGAKIAISRFAAVTLRLEEVELRNQGFSTDRSVGDVGVGLSLFGRRSPSAGGSPGPPPPGSPPPDTPLPNR